MTKQRNSIMQTCCVKFGLLAVAIHQISAYLNYLLLVSNCKVNSVQEACSKCLVVHISKFEILQITWKRWTSDHSPFLQYGWFLQNFVKDFMRTNMHTTASSKKLIQIYSDASRNPLTPFTLLVCHSKERNMWQELHTHKVVLLLRLIAASTVVSGLASAASEGSASNQGKRR